MRFLVDTNVISELRRRRPAASVVAWFSAQAPETIFTSVIVLGEIRRGIELIARRDREQAIPLERWYNSFRLRLGERTFAVDEQTMNAWATMSAPDMLPAYDGLIAATALIHDLVIVTRNTADYRRTGLRVLDPWADR